MGTQLSARISIGIMIATWITGCTQHAGIRIHKPQPVTSLRQVQVSVLSTEERPPVKVIAIVDNSASMKPHQEKLANSLASFMKSLSDAKIPVEVKAYTTTGVRWFQQDPKRAPGATTGTEKQSFLRVAQWYSDPAGTMPVADSMGNTAPLNLETLVLGRPTNFPNQLLLTPQMTKEALQTAMDKIQDTIQNVGVLGSEEEHPLCTALRVARERGTTRAILPGENVALLTLTDSDDFTTRSNVWSNCFKNIRWERDPLRPAETGSTGTYPLIGYRYALGSLQARYRTDRNLPTCAQDEDCLGNSLLEPARVGIQACPATGTACSETVLADLARQGVVGLVKGSCSVYCDRPNGLKWVDDQAGFANRKHCSEPITFQNVTYPHYEALALRNDTPLTRSVIKGTCGQTFWSLVAPMNARPGQIMEGAVDQDSLQRAIASSLEAVTGSRDRFFFGLIGNHEKLAPRCADPGPVQSDQLLRFAGSLGANGSGDSICAPNYDRALDKVLGFIKRSTLQNVDVPGVGAREIISSVVILRGTTRIGLGANQYAVGTRIAGTGVTPLNISEPLKPGDRIEVSLSLPPSEL